MRLWFLFSRIFRPCPTTVDLTSGPVMGRSSSTRFSRRRANIATTSASTTAKVEIVPPTDVEGMRKVKHLTVSLTTAGEDTSESTAFYWARVCSSGTAPGSSTSHQQEHSQCMNLISLSANCGVVGSFSWSHKVYFSRVSYLNDGDSIYLLIRNTLADFALQ